MKRNAKQSGAGGRLRLGLLSSIAAAFLLVPASQALAAPTLEVNLIGVNGGGGEVVSLAPLTGSPPISCELPEGGTQTGTCTTTMTSFEGAWAVWLNPATPGPNSVIKEWVVHEPGIEANQCGEGDPQCTAATEAETGTVVVDVEFERVKPNLKVDVVNLGEGGGGEVVSPYTGVPIPGTPPLSCNLPEGGAPEGVCENLMDYLEEGVYGVAMKALAAPNSEFVEWVPISGTFLSGASACAVDPTNPTSCFVVSEGEEAEVEAIFACEAGKSCPPEPDYPLTINPNPGNGTGTVECKVNGGAQGACPTEVEGGSEVEVIATPGTGSKPAVLSGTGSAAACVASPCTFTMEEPSSVNAEFNLKTYSLTTTPIENGGTGSFECDINSAGLGACPASVTHGDVVIVVASAGAESEVNTISGSGSCSVAGDRQSGTCEFTATANSTVVAEFVSEGKIVKDPGNVKGSVDLQTTLETEDCDDVDLGPFVPSASPEEYANDECVVTVTATGTENELRAADETGGLGGTDQTGHLTQEPGDPFTLDNALEVRGTGTTGGAAPSGYLPLSSTALLQDYGTPVSLDVVTVEFRQLIDAFEPLHTGTYDKTITLTLEQDVL